MIGYCKLDEYKRIIDCGYERCFHSKRCLYERKEKENKMKTYVGFVRDHSGSMGSLRFAAMRDYNLMLQGIKNSVNPVHEIKAAVVECGVGYYGDVRLSQYLRDITYMDELKDYKADGGRTPLWSSVFTAINELKKPLYNSINEQIAYLVMVTTDGQNNVNNDLIDSLKKDIRDLQATDLWTFVFRVPVGYKRNIVQLGIPEGNVIEWEQTDSGVAKSTAATTQGITGYFTTRSAGQTSTKAFYTNMEDVSLREVKQNLTDITKDLFVTKVKATGDGMQIRDFCNLVVGKYEIGKAFYQLMKPETIQPQKKVIIKHKKSGKYYGGSEARDLLGLPDHELRVRPGDHAGYEIYVQSTSVNRKMVVNTNLIYWENA